MTIGSACVNFLHLTLETGDSRDAIFPDYTGYLSANIYSIFDFSQTTTLFLDPCVLESVNTFVTGSFYWRVLVSCRQNTSYYCTLGLPWDLNKHYQGVHSNQFSDQNKPLLCAVPPDQLATAWAQLMFTIEANAANSITNTLYCPLNSLASAACDAIITISIWIYLRPLRNSPFHKDQYIDQFNLIFVEMGMITFATGVLMMILYTQISASGSYLTAGPSAVLSKSQYRFTTTGVDLTIYHIAYANSMLAV
ncbi:hypothetical protein SCLCIDRAFT_1159071 [Scleroderma citrinum Foug A]|uniref:DUF6534 domain-containing protein n=1 Tax=Scleroderma citrinum Foug A TaxID=1036808 RepID=A0A0C3EBY9_9AGAM|nr:hypothetical protein SCLCIDRAFT_1159071 [Scleroderma citrinum Foug A]